MRRLVLVRHGQSVWNAQRRIQGHSGAGLTDTGTRQAAATAIWLADIHPEARVVSSDLQRCRETASPIGAALAVDVVTDVALRERSFGRWEGKALHEVQAEDADLWDQWRTGTDVVRRVGGESGEDLATRVATAFRRHVDATEDGGTVVVVTHGGPIWHGLHALLDLPWGTLGGVGNASVTELVLDETGSWCESWNQTAHLPAELRTSFRPSEMRAAAADR